MYCIKCGKEIPSGEMICPDCLEAEKKANTAETPDVKNNNTEETDANPEIKAEGEGTPIEEKEQAPFNMPNPNMPPFPPNGYANPTPTMTSPYQPGPYAPQMDPYAQNPYNQPYGRPTPPPPMPRPPKTPTSAMGLAGFCLSLVAFLLLVLIDINAIETVILVLIPSLVIGFIFSIIGTKECKTGMRSGKGFAKTGFILSIIILAIFAFYITISFFALLGL